MMITLEAFAMVVSMIISAVALFFALKKQGHSEDNMDADTILNLFKTVAEQEKKQKDLREEFDKYKETSSVQIADLISENIRLRKWVKALIDQLKAAGMKPINKEI